MLFKATIEMCLQENDETFSQDDEDIDVLLRARGYDMSHFCIGKMVFMTVLADDRCSAIGILHNMCEDVIAEEVFGFHGKYNREHWHINAWEVRYTIGCTPSWTAARQGEKIHR